jgi:hypothetical protein
MVWRWRAYLRAEFAVLNVMAVSFQAAQKVGGDCFATWDLLSSPHEFIVDT